MYQSYWDLNSPIVVIGMALIPLIYAITGIRVLSKYFEYKQRNYITFGLAILFFGCFWWNMLLYTFSSFLGITLNENIYFIISFNMFPFGFILWTYNSFIMAYKKHKRKISVITFALALLFEAYFIFFLFADKSIIGEIIGGFYWYPSIYTLIILIILALFSVSGVILIMKRAFASKDREIRKKGSLLGMAFVVFIAGGLSEILIPYTIFSFALSRILLLVAPLLFYFGLFLPKKDTRLTIGKWVANILLLLLFLLPFNTLIEFLQITVLYLTFFTFVTYWDMGLSLSDFNDVENRKEKILLNTILIGNLILILSTIFNIVNIGVAFYLFNEDIRYIAFGFYLSGQIIVYIVRFRDLKDAWRGSSATTYEDIVKEGFYRLSRHPIYFFSIFVNIGLGLFLNTIWSITAGVVIALCYVLLGKYEEEALALEDPEYRRYKESVPYTPFGWLNPRFYKERKKLL
jgi:protein-S-isoprenylcysteine O-methyltransferase Ste14